jgi:tetratricopeptide (TPR) repeat protein
MEGQEWLSAAVAKLRPDTPPALEAQLRQGLGEIWPNANIACLELTRAATLYHSLNDLPRLGGALARLGFALLVSGHIDEAERTSQESLELLTRVGKARKLAMAYSTKFCIDARLGRRDAARAAGEKAMSLCEIAGAQRQAFVVAANLVEASLERGDLDGAIAGGKRLANSLRETFHSNIRGFVLGILCGALTARGDIEDALVVAREAAPLLRDESRLFWLFDHLALRAGLAGRLTDAALLLGYADAAYRMLDQQREPPGCHAVERLGDMLCKELLRDDIAELSRLGAQLSEEQAMALAFGA